FLVYAAVPPRALHSFPTRRSSDLGTCGRAAGARVESRRAAPIATGPGPTRRRARADAGGDNPFATRARGGTRRVGSEVGGFATRSEEHTSELQSRVDLVCRLLLEK